MLTYQRLQSAASSLTQRDQDPLLLAPLLAADVLDRLLFAYKALAEKDGIAAAIAYLITARQSSLLDLAFANALPPLRQLLTPILASLVELTR